MNERETQHHGSIDRHASSRTRLVYVAVHQTININHSTDPPSPSKSVSKHVHANVVRAKIDEEECRDGGEGTRGGEGQVSKIVENVGSYGRRSKR